MTVADQCATELLDIVPSEHKLMADCLIRPQMIAMEAEFGPEIVRGYTDQMKAAYVTFTATGDPTAIIEAIGQFDPMSAQMLRDATNPNPGQ